MFYVVFYAALAGFFAGLLAIFWQTLDLNRPKWQLSESIIGTNPGLGFRPMPPEAHLGSTLVWYKASRPDNMRFWFETVNKFLDGKYICRQITHTHKTHTDQTVQLIRHTSFDLMHLFRIP